jgi:hypothetical protein
MQTGYCYSEFQYVPQLRIKNRKFRITSRDLEVLVFLLEMKFATIAEIHFKFFRGTREGGFSTSYRWAWERIGALVDEGLIDEISGVVAKTTYICTNKGYRFAKNCLKENFVCRPAGGLDRNTYDHDLAVTRLRLILEDSNIVQGWQSERSIEEDESATGRFQPDFIPDGVYTGQNSKRVAVEVEMSRKSKSRYREKVNKYIDVIRSAGADAKFQEVHYYCISKEIIQLIEAEASLFAKFIKVMRLPEEIFDGRFANEVR